MEPPRLEPAPPARGGGLRPYGVETRALNQAVNHKLDRFPEELAFPLTRAEILSISQTVTSLGHLRLFSQPCFRLRHSEFCGPRLLPFEGLIGRQLTLAAT